jgi:small redox-active disulfide protein 2
MERKDVTRIRVGSHEIGVVGLKRTLEEIAEEAGSRNDEEIRAALLDRMSKENYIPSSARERYAQAFFLEFQRLMGESCGVEPSRGLEIKVLGPGCAQCDQLTNTIMEVLAEIGLAADVDHVRDIKEIARSGVMGTPALIVNGKVLSVGRVPPRNKIREWLTGATA